MKLKFLTLCFIGGMLLDEKEREWVFVTKSARPHNQGKICHG
jgi:hypothetical protein